MYKPPKDDTPVGPMRLKLPSMTGTPTVKQVKEQLEHSKDKRGFIIEQPWKTARAGQLFNLMVQWDKTADQPVWTLYEENGPDSKMHWSQPFVPSDLEILYDIISMSAADGSAAKIPDSLKPPEKSAGGSGGGGGGPTPGAPRSSGLGALGGGLGGGGGGAGGLGGSFLGGKANSYSTPSIAPEPTPVPAPAPAADPYPAMANPVYSEPMFTEPAYTPQPAYPPPQPAYPPPQPAYPPPQPAYPPPQPAYPPPQPAYPPPQQAYPPPQPSYPPPQPGYGYGGYPPPQQPGYPGYPAATPAEESPWITKPAETAKSQAGSSSTSSSMPPEMFPVKGGQTFGRDTGSSGTNILLGTLLFEAGFINQPTLDAALKLQELVRDSRIAIPDAPDALKRLHTMGSNIDEYLNKGDSNSAKGSSNTGPAKNSPANVNVAEQRAAFDLLQKAGLLKEDDLKSASAVRSKHGGDMVVILQAANKLDLIAYKAAQTCLPLIRDNKMKVEQCIIALNYCTRSRVDFKTALDEMGWPQPGK